MKIIEWFKDRYKIFLTIFIFVILPTIIGRFFILDEYALLLACWGAGMIPVGAIIYIIVIIRVFVYVIFFTIKRIKNEPK